MYNNSINNDIHNYYTDKQLFGLLNLNSPSDRELEAQINNYLRKYRDHDELFTFFTGVYNHFFLVDEEPQQQRQYPQQEGFEVINQGESELWPDIPVLEKPEIFPSNATATATATANENANANAHANVNANANANVNANANAPLPPQIKTQKPLKPKIQKQKPLNPYLKTVKRLVCIDSQFRDTAVYPNSSHFKFELADSLLNVISLKLYSVQIPYSWYTINSDFGSNFFYIKGNSPGIDQGYYDYKISIQPGNYESQEFVTYINESLQTNVILQNPDINFGTSAVSYNNVNSKLTMTIDIKSVYNEKYYQLVFPTFSSFVDNTVTSLPQLFGYKQNIYSPCTLLSNITINPILFANNITLTLKNNYITIYLYQGIISNSRIDYSLTSTVVNTITIVSSLSPGIHSSQTILTNFQSLIANNIYLDSFKSFLIYNTELQKYQLTIITNRLKVTNGINIKCAIVFGIDVDNPLWIGINSLFQFDQSWNDMNNIISDVSSKITQYTLQSSPTIKFQCKNSNYNISLNNREFTISNQLSPYTSFEYLDIINLGLQTSITDPFQCIIQNISSIPTISCYINNNIPFYTNDIPNFQLITENSVLHSILNFPKIITNTITNTSFRISKNGYTMSNTNKIFKLQCIGKRNINIEPISIIIPTPDLLNTEHVFIYLESFIDAINSSFINTTVNNENGTNIDFSGTKLEIIQYNQIDELIECRLTLNAQIVLTQKDYKMFLYDPYGYDGSITNNTWENEKNSWYSFLHFSQSSYDLNLTSIIESSQPFYSNQLLLTNANNSFFINAIENEIGGVYIKGTTTYNIPIVLTLPIGFYYTKENIVTNINQLLYENTISRGSYIDITNSKTHFRININKIFTSQDYRLVFFDKTFIHCKYSNTSSVENVKWDTTLGWILGYRNLTEYNLSITNVTKNEINYNTFYDIFPSQAFEVNIDTNIVKLTGDTSINVNLYNYALIVLDDYCQNHLNDGLLTISKSDQTISLPSYASRITTICDKKTNTITKQSNNLTAKQLYSANQILQTKALKQNQIGRTASSFIQDIFSFIPLKTSGLSRGQSFVDSSGSLQSQQRTYVGPVNIHRLEVRLLSDKGNILNLNGVNWCFTFLAEQLFKVES